MEYMYELKGELHGPISHEQLAELIRERRISPSTNVLKKGQAQWKRASEYFAQSEITPDVSATKHNIDTKKPHRLLSYLANHWRGQTTLAQAFWVNGVVLSVLIGFATQLLFTQAPDNPIELKPYAYLALTIIVAELIVRVWQWVGIYRTAINAELTTKPVWCTWAKWSVILGAMLLIVNFKSLVLVSGDMVKLANYQDDLGGFTVQVDASAKSLIYEGAITAGSPEAIESLLKDHPDVETIVLNSPGGFLGPAYRMGKILKQSAVRSAEVHSHCESACTLVLLSVDKRILHATGQIGFHQPADAVDTYLGKEQIHHDIRSMQQWMRSHGVSDVFSVRAMRTPASRMFYARPWELLQHGVITEYQLDGQVAEVDELLATGLAEKFSSPSSIEALKRHHGNEFKRILNHFKLELKSEGWMEGLFPDTKDAYWLATNHALAKASTASLRDIFRQDTQVMMDLNALYPTTCARLAGYIDYDEQEPPAFEQFVEAREALRAKAYQTSATEEELQVDEQKASWATIRVNTWLQTSDHSAYSLFNGRTLGFFDHKIVCQAAIKVRQEIDRLPDDLLGAFLRRNYAANLATKL